MGINQYYMGQQRDEALVAASQGTPFATATAANAPVANATPLAANIDPNSMTTMVAPVAVPTPVAAELLSFENEVLSARFDQNGGCVGPVLLKDYRAKMDTNDLAVLNEGYNLCKSFGTRLNNIDARATLMHLEKPSPARFEFKAPVQDDIEVLKSIDFSQGKYRGTLSLTVKNIGLQTKSGQLELELGATSDEKPAGWFSGQLPSHEFLVHWDDKTHRTSLAFNDSPTREVLDEQKQIVPKWIGTGSLYFLTALLPRDGKLVDVSVLQTGFNIQRNQQTAADRTVYEAWINHPYQLVPGATQTWEYDVYMGPKIKDQLEAFKDKKLEQAINYGFFEIVAWPIFYALRAINQVVHNWGFAIIILTIIIKMILYPLTRMAYVAGKKMQKVQPQMAAIREKYKDDKMKMNQETMALMSTTGTNPLSGCLPILPTIPIFFALFSVLQTSFELRHAPFLFWIRDLSAMDPLFITPVALAISYYIQQRLTPMPTMDPAQAKMMQFLPLIFAVFMLTFPSGLVIYSLVNSVMTMIQQQYMMRKYKDL